MPVHSGLAATQLCLASFNKLLKSLLFQMKVDGLPPRHLDIMMLLTNAEWVHVPLAKSCMFSWWQIISLKRVILKTINVIHSHVN